MRELEDRTEKNGLPATGNGGDKSAQPVLPEDMLIVLPVRNLVLFPGVILPVAIKREKTVAGAQEAVRAEGKVGFLLQKDPETEDPGFDELQRIGTAASIVRYITAPDGTHHLVCQGERRFRVLDAVSGFPYLVARVEWLNDTGGSHPEVEARVLYLKQKAVEAITLLPQAPAELANSIQAIESPATLADTIASFLDIKPVEKQELLEITEIRERLEKVSAHLTRRVEVLKLSRQIEEQTKEAIDDRQREYVLREQLKQIQKELGEEAEGEETAELEEAIAKAGMPEEVEKEARKELKRLERMNEASGEYSMARTYLDTLIALPWSKLDPESIDIERARGILDADHYGLEKIKKRILEYLAVRKLNPEGRSPILCFVGPPGVGKTSLGQSIARAIGLKFQRTSLGGTHDEAEIRGHRRTYIGALPGNVIQAIRKAGTRNPVLMLDEIDKLGHGIQGDPASALLEVLDPEQNSTFRDNYVGVPFDLSKVLFIATANQLDTIPGPLRDRMEIIELTGYTEDEKVEIARRYLVRRQLEANGLKPEQALIEDEALHVIAREYTREAGCRNLEREVGAVLRNVAVRVAEGKATSVRIAPGDVREILGPPRFENEVAMRVSVPGVATGLAWTPVGGDILFIEATRVPGSGKLILTGQLGEVMKESAQAALSLLKSQAESLGVDSTRFEKADVHVHVPAGAIPKDGPSAGVALYTALVSLMTGKTVRNDVAMTGEISLRGLVLPVGGIKEKTVAAHRAGIRTVMLPARNRRDYEEIPQTVRNDIEFVWLERVEDAIAHAIDGAVPKAA
ncbi:MAG: ATP-dependent Lon protease [Steroidobacteraceae bacterium]|jgi:ATP-dependent Lon protease|nr:ATP-dependent Lon protease [Steroidobacteraceae bacterium]